MTAYPYWVFTHVFSAFLFLVAHGISIGAGFMIRRERDPQRLKPLLELSFASVGAVHMTMLLVLITGVVLGFLGDWWGWRWIWVSLGLFIVMWGAMAGLGTRHQDKIRVALGLKPFYGKKDPPLPPPAPRDELERLLVAPRFVVLLALGVAALLVFLWLMMFKPF